MSNPRPHAPPRLLAGALLAAVAAAPRARADTYARQPLDVLHYDVALSFREDFAYEADVRLDVRLAADGLARLRLDCDGPQVDRVSLHGARLQARQEAGALVVELGQPRSTGEILPLRVEYHGRPDGRGLAAGRDAHGHLGLFADNWPESARHWLPSIDHPSDKATVDFTVTLADRLDVVAPGRLVETRARHDGRRTWRWSEAVPIPTYSMVIGAAEFQVSQAGSADGVPLSVWTAPEDAANGARLFARTAAVLGLFSDLVGPFPYEKLAQVQSSTQYGGMENASAIFYAEKVVHAPGEGGAPVAHEVAHQWWGDSVTPADWDDLWLSEGFATYFDALFDERARGKPALAERMQRAAASIRQALAKRPGAVVDPEVARPSDKLGAFTYEKGAWVLHMLRHRLGDPAFFDGLRSHYRAHTGSNATSEDLRHALEAASGQPLAAFFRQWLARKDLPALSVAWRWDATALEAILEVVQTQPGEPYALDLDVALRTGDRVATRTIAASDRRTLVRLPLAERPESVAVDPDSWLLLAAPVVAAEAAPLAASVRSVVRCRKDR